MSANNFQLTLDTLAPSGSISPGKDTLTATNSSLSLSIEKGDATYMQVWYDTSDKTLVAPENTPWIAAASSHTIGFTADGSYYAHVILMDDVRNKSTVLTSGQIIFDTILPVIDTSNTYAEDLDSKSHIYTNAAEFKFMVTASDADSGLQKVVLSGNFIGSPKTVSAASFNSSSWSGQLTFNSDATHGSQTIHVVAYDNAGNTSTHDVSIIYDPDPVQGSFALKATASADTVLQDYINASNNSFVAVITATAGTSNDIAYYRIWGDIQDHTSATDVVWPANTASVTVNNLKFTTTDGIKTVNVQLIDKAGNITTLTPQTRHYDATNPTCDLWVDTNPSQENQRLKTIWIAAGSGTKNDTTVYYSADDNTSGGGSGIKSIVFNLKNGSTDKPIKTINFDEPSSSDSGNFSFSTALFPEAAAGSDLNTSNTISMTITDRADNRTTKQVTINIEKSFTLDSISLGGHALEEYQGYYNDDTKNAITVTVNNSTAPGSGRGLLRVWTDSAESATDVPTGTPELSWTASPQLVANTSINKNFTDNSSGNYLHVKAISAVGNVAYKHINFIVDVTAPTYTTVVDSRHTNSRTNKIRVNDLADNLSGVDKIKLSAKDGTLLESGTFDWAIASNTVYTVTLDSSSAEGIHAVIIQVRDKANNITTKEVSWEYDNTAPAGTLTLKEEDGTTNKSSPSAIQTFRAVIAYSEDTTDTFGTIQYKIYGDIATTADGAAITEADAQWQPFTTGATVTTDVLYCTVNPADAPADGVTKCVYVKLKDDAGNIMGPVEATFVYNPRPTELTITSVSHQRISCTHELRIRIPDGEDSASPITGDFADIVSFTVNSPQIVQAWKVCAYTKYPSSNITGDTVTAMTKREGSYATQGYSQTGLSVTAWTVTIDGQDFRNAVGTDGIHYIVVFGQNLAGKWSIAGTPVNI